MDRQKRNEIIELVDTFLKPSGVECLEVELDAAEKVLRLFIDKPEGVKMEDCAEVNRVLIEQESIDQVIPDNFRLEVSSPGVERPLRTCEHFRQVIGEQVKVKLTQVRDHRKQASGLLVAVGDGNEVHMRVDGEDWSFSLDELNSANLVYDWSRS